MISLFLVYYAYIQIEKKSNFWLKVSNFNQKAPWQARRNVTRPGDLWFFWCVSLAVKKQTNQRFKFSLKKTHTQK